MDNHSIKNPQIQTIVFSINYILSKGESESIGSYLQASLKALYYSLLYISPIFSFRIRRCWNHQAQWLTNTEYLFSLVSTDSQSFYYSDSLGFLVERLIVLSIDALVYIFLFKTKSFEKSSKTASILRKVLLVKYCYLNTQVIVHLQKPLKCIPRKDGLKYIAFTDIDCSLPLSRLNLLLTIVCLLMQGIMAFIVIYSNFNHSLRSGRILSMRSNSDYFAITFLVSFSFLIMSNFMAHYSVGLHINMFSFSIMAYLTQFSTQYRDIYAGRIFSIPFKIGFFICLFQCLCYYSEYPLGMFIGVFIAVGIVGILILIYRHIPLARYLPVRPIKEINDIDMLVYQLEGLVYFVEAGNRSLIIKGLIEGFAEYKKWGGAKSKTFRITSRDNNQHRAIFCNEKENNINSSESQILKEKVVSFVYLEYIKAMKLHPRSMIIRLSYINFLHEIVGSSIEAFSQLKQFSFNKRRISSSFQIEIQGIKQFQNLNFESRSLISLEISRSGDQSIDVQNFRHVEEFLKSIDATSHSVLLLWQYLEEDIINYSYLSKLIGDSVDKSSVVDELWHKNGPRFLLNPSLLLRYSNYLSYIQCNDRDSFYYQQKAAIEMKYQKERNKDYLQFKSPKDDVSIVSTGVAIIQIGSYKDQSVLFTLYKCNISFAAMLGFPRTAFLESENLSKIFPDAWLNILSRTCKSKQNISISNLTVYLKQYLGVLMRFTISIRELVEGFLIIEIKPVFSSFQQPEIIFSPSTCEIIGHNSCLMKFFEVDFFDLKTINIKKITDIYPEVVCTQNDCPNIIINRSKDKRGTGNTIYSKMTNTLKDKARNKICHQVKGLVKEIRDLTFGDFQDQLDLKLLVIRPRDQISTVSIANFKRIKKQTSFQFNFNIARMTWNAGFREDVTKSNTQAQQSKLYAIITQAENATRVFKKKMQEISYEKGIRVTRLIEGGTKMMEVNMNDIDSDRSDGSDQSNKRRASIEIASNIIQFKAKRKTRRRILSSKKDPEKIDTKDSFLIKFYITITIAFLVVFLLLSFLYLYKLYLLHPGGGIMKYVLIKMAGIKIEQTMAGINNGILDIQLSKNESSVIKAKAYISEAVETFNSKIKEISSLVVSSNNKELSHAYFESEIDYDLMQFHRVGTETGLSIYKAISTVLSDLYHLAKPGVSLSTRIVDNCYFFMRNALGFLYTMENNAAMHIVTVWQINRYYLLFGLSACIGAYLLILVYLDQIMRRVSIKTKLMFVNIHSFTLVSLSARCERFITYQENIKNNDEIEDEVLGEKSSLGGSINNGAESVASSIRRKGGDISLGPLVTVPGLKRRRKTVKSLLNKGLLLLFFSSIPILLSIMWFFYQNWFKPNDIRVFYSVYQYFPYASRAGHIAISQKKILSSIDKPDESTFKVYNEQLQELPITLNLLYTVATLTNLPGDMTLATVNEATIYGILYSSACQISKMSAELDPPNFFKLDPNVCEEDLYYPSYNKKGLQYSLLRFKQEITYIDKILKLNDADRITTASSQFNCPLLEGQSPDYSCLVNNIHVADMIKYVIFVLGTSTFNIPYLFLAQKLALVDIEQKRFFYGAYILIALSILSIIFVQARYIFNLEKNESKVRLGIEFIPLDVRNEIEKQIKL